MMHTEGAAEWGYKSNADEGGGAVEQRAGAIVNTATKGGRSRGLKEGG